MAIVPGDKLGCRMASRKILAFNAKSSVYLRPGGEEYHVIEVSELVDREVLAHLNVAEVAKPRSISSSLELPRHVSNLFVVWRHPGSHEPVRCRKTIVQVNG